MSNNHYKLENILISSRAHLRSLELKAYFKGTKDLHFDGLPNHYSINTMTRMQGNRYLANVRNLDTLRHESHCLNVDTMTTERLEVKTGDNTNNCFVEGQYMLVVRHTEPIAILRGLQDIGIIEFKGKQEFCKNNCLIYGMYEQHVGHRVYAVDNNAHLYRIEWQDIKDGKYVKTLEKENVKHFYVDKGLGLATVNVAGTLSLASDTKVDLKAKVDSKATWTIVTCIAKCWIVCGDLDLETDGHAIMAGISKQGYIISTLKLKLTSNGYINNNDIKFAGIYSLHQAYVRGRRGIMLSIERDGCCHLISAIDGRLSNLQSIGSIVPLDVVEIGDNRVVNCVTATAIEGEFIAGGFGWTRRINVKLK